MNKSIFSNSEREYMSMALTLAQRGLGRVAPNPAVGCVIIREDLNGKIVGRGWTQPGGRPHAEIEAIRRAGNLAKKGTAFITLEPCSHFGETPPCAKAIIKSGIKKVFISIEDPDKRVSGSGIKILKEAGITVILGLLKDEARILNAGFFSCISNKRPMITWKVASSADGKIATKSGDSKWITGKLSRKYVHLIRSQHDAIITSAQTIISDDSRLTCRLPGMMSRSPQPIVLDTKLSLPVDSYVMSKGRRPWIYTNALSHTKKHAQLEKLGAHIFYVSIESNGNLSLSQVLSHLTERGITRILLESGGRLAGSFIKDNLIDQIFWFHAPCIIGNDGIPVIGSLNISFIKDAMLLKQNSTTSLEGDTLNVFTRKLP